MTKMIVISAALPAAGLILFTLAAMASPPTTTVITDNFVYFDPCSNENVQMNGTTTIRSSSSVTNEIEHISMHLNQKDTGVGLTSGAEYRVNGEDNEEVNIKLVNGTGEENAVGQFNVIGHGKAPNEHLKESLHVTVNANGTVTVERTSITDSCQ